MKSARRSEGIFIKKISNFQKKRHDLQEKMEHYSVGDDSLDQDIQELIKDVYNMIDDLKIAQENRHTILSYIFKRLSCGELNRRLGDKYRDVLRAVRFQHRIGRLHSKTLMDFTQELVMKIEARRG
ncbi:hypothetical protein M441DRAFT_34520 [Trichoderma asperellum CBS 433.97]|uniref:Uncharacterized protein n=1 Tax=Trichoderma asperellum (strain ATCC 204424 / CBS 433.97 / NBRC 101777) TaxID=1042311 RepID=A0A2T3ZGB1_TRIA4|nr:hypothetical protein M441DRAFT_34520 [Trichoderma asperellum CBS 433.97]PTB43836.1 hypothetical protein M441DRAFT_34520 [Trichoderma asperellum CBS 433.97]